MKKVLVTDYVHDSLIEGLQQMGFAVEYIADYDPAKLDAALPELTGIVINSKIKMTEDRINLGANLKFIARLGSGLEIIDLKAAQKNNIAVFNSPEGNRNAVAEHAIGMLLCLANNILKGDREVRKRIWEREQNRGFEIESKTIGIVGFGNTGQSLARKLSNWTHNIVYYDPYVLDIPKDLTNIMSVNLDELQLKADIISLHVQLTPETYHLVDASFIKNCKQGFILVNTSRGAVINTEDVINSLESGYISGACLDVFENEKPNKFTSKENSLYNRLYDMENVVLTPHVAGWTHESLYKIAQVLLDKVKSTF